MDFLNMLLCAGLFGAPAETAAGAEGQAQGSSWYIIVIYVVIFAAFIYFLMIRPSRKQKKQQEETMGSMQPGDSVLTTSGFYGTIVSVNGDTVIVEFGNNKNCRIPMAKQAISQVEKAGAQGASATSTDASPVKKFFGRRRSEAEEAAGEVQETAQAAAGQAQEVKDAVSEAAEDVKETAENIAGDDKTE